MFPLDYVLRPNHNKLLLKETDRETERGRQKDITLCRKARPMCPWLCCFVTMSLLS